MAPAEPARRRGFGVVFWLSAAWTAMVVFGAVFADILPIRDPNELGIRTGDVERFEPPGRNAFFGGDAQGKDLFSNVIHGARPALLLGIAVTIIAASLGTTLGVIAGFVRGKADGLIMSAVDISLAFPGLVLLVSVTAVWGNSLPVLILAFSVLGIAPYARIVRATTLSVAEREFVEAAQSMGAGRVRVLRREIVPNVMLPVLSYAFLGFAIVIATEGALSFIGLSLDEVTWGGLIADGQGVIRNASHLALIPATVMFLTILAFNFLGDGVRTRFDARPVLTTAKRPLPREGSPPAVSDTLLSIRDLHTMLHTEPGTVHAVDGVSLDLAAGETLGIVGESGSGKTMLLRSILGTFPIPDVTRTGAIGFEGADLLRIDGAEHRRILGTEIGVVSQNPLTALNPVRTVGSQLIETMRVHRGLGRVVARAQAIDLLRQVGIPEPEGRLDSHPHALSGGMRQRATIAMALANEPKLLLADEPTTALDVTVQDQILSLLASLCEERHMALVLVTHDLSVVRGWTDRVAVMYAGQIVESGPTETLFVDPKHRYTQALLDSIPHLDLPSHSELAVIDGRPPLLIDPPTGCRFAPRCDWAEDGCRDTPPQRVEIAGHAHTCLIPASRDAVGDGVSRGR